MARRRGGSEFENFGKQSDGASARGKDRGQYDPSGAFVVPQVDIPLDEEDSRFVRSFALDQKAEFTAFFEEFGFVVVRDVLSPDECRASIDDIWQYLESRSYVAEKWDNPDYKDTTYPPPARIERDDPSTWNNDWPGPVRPGILGQLPIFTKQALLNRQNANIYSVFTTLMGRQDLMVSQDRYGMFRPFKSRDGGEDSRWKTTYSVHWDLNPWRYSLDERKFKQGAASMRRFVRGLTYRSPNDFFEENNEVGTAKDDKVNLQGLINFADNLAEDGGFQLVVGFHRHIERWAQSTKDNMSAKLMDKAFIQVHGDDPLYKQAQRVSMRAGSIVVWDQRMAHGSAPNESANLRFCQFMKMSPSLDPTTSQAKYRSRVVQQKVAHAGAELSEIGMKLFGLERWK